jgi:hypothetical protein
MHNRIANPGSTSGPSCIVSGISGTPEKGIAYNNSVFPDCEARPWQLRSQSPFKHETILDQSKLCRLRENDTTIGFDNE